MDGNDYEQIYKEPKGREEITDERSTLQIIKQLVLPLHFCKYVFITAGDGMSQESDVDTFKAPRDFWATFPDFWKEKLNMRELHTPQLQKHDPGAFWGYVYHSMKMVKEGKPGRAFRLLKQLVAHHIVQDYFVVTSTNDGLFTKSQFAEDDNIWELYGNYNYFQCESGSVWKVRENDGFEIHFDEKTQRAVKPFPTCMKCEKCKQKGGGEIRPNVLMFNDDNYNTSRGTKQATNFNKFVEKAKSDSCAIIELGSELHLPTIRLVSEKLACNSNTTLIRINYHNAFVLPEEEEYLKTYKKLENLYPIEMTCEYGLERVLHKLKEHREYILNEIKKLNKEALDDKEVQDEIKRINKVIMEKYTKEFTQPVKPVKYTK